MWATSAIKKLTKLNKCPIFGPSGHPAWPSLPFTFEADLTNITQGTLAANKPHRRRKKTIFLPYHNFCHTFCHNFATLIFTLFATIYCHNFCHNFLVHNPD
jgi:hypothetical protein